jgi:hypothetical protein
MSGPQCRILTLTYVLQVGSEHNQIETTDSTAVFQIRDILRRIRILRSKHWITETDLDPVPNPHPALFVNGFQDVNKKKFVN